MHSPTLGAVGLVIGFFVGLTGMGGGALLTSVLVLGFGIPPLAAISNDLFASLIMKPFAVPVHLRRRTVHWRLAGLLALGSVPSAFLGAVLVGVLGHAAAVQNNLKFAIGSDSPCPSSSPSRAKRSNADAEARSPPTTCR